MKIAVVGAGPAGVSAAFFCKYFDRDNEHDVYLFERLDEEKWRKYHSMCGEAVSAAAFEDIKPIEPTNIIENISKLEDHYPDDITISTRTMGYIIDRPLVLRKIIDKFINIGGNYRMETITPDRFNEFCYVIAADGVNSGIRKSLDIRDPRKVFAVQYLVDSEIEEHDTLHFYYDEKYGPDYKWVFPYKDKTKVGYPLVGGNNVTKPKGVKSLSTHSRAIGFGGVDQLVKRDILLVGDAAGQTNPLTKGGIRPAMLAGKMAAEAVLTGKPTEYESRWRYSPFSSSILLKAYNQLGKMGNVELLEHIRLLQQCSSDKTHKKFLGYAKTFLFYRKYIRLCRAYNLCGEFGW